MGLNLLEVCDNLAHARANQHIGLSIAEIEGAAVARRSLGFMQLAIIAGYSMFYTLYLITFFGLFLYFPETASFTEVHLGQVVYYAGAVGGSGLILLIFKRKNNSSLVNSKRFLWGFGVLSLALPICSIADALGTPASLPVFYICCLLCGLHIAPAFMYWDDLCERGYLKNSMYTHGVIFAIGGCIFLAATFVLDQFSLGVLCMLLAFLSVGLLVFINQRAEAPESDSVESAVQAFKTMRHLDITALAVNIVFGFAFIIAYYRFGIGVLAAMAIAIVADFLLTLITRRGYILPFVGMLRICTAASCVVLIAFSLPQDVPETVALGLIVAMWFLYRTINGGALVELANRRELSVLYTVGRGKFSSNLGFCIGLLVGIVGVGMGNSEQNIAYFALGITAFVIVIALLLLPFDNESDVPGLKTLMPFKATEVPNRSASPRAEQCKRLADHYKLSPREIEVLSLVSEGRNAKHVAEKLFISESTAKTHMANIYRKVNVHSQQELLDLLDQV